MGRFLRRAHRSAAPDELCAWRRVRGSGRFAAAGAVAVLGIALSTGDPAQAMPMPQPDGGAAAVAGSAGSGQAASAAAEAGSFRQITLPDLLIVAPSGLTARQIGQLGKIRGLRSMITFDGARITAGGRPVSVIGVNPATFRSWVPLRTASDQAFWTALSTGDFVASQSASNALGLKAGKSYPLVGASAQVVKFGMAARLNLAGVDLMVNQATSARLGLVRQVAGLISAPAMRIATLTRKVARILGPSGRFEQLRGQLPGSSVRTGTEPTSYIQLFKASAATYCP